MSTNNKIILVPCSRKFKENRTSPVIQEICRLFKIDLSSLVLALEFNSKGEVHFLHVHAKTWIAFVCIEDRHSAKRVSASIKALRDALQTVEAFSLSNWYVDNQYIYAVGVNRCTRQSHVTLQSEQMWIEGKHEPGLPVYYTDSFYSRYSSISTTQSILSMLEERGIQLLSEVCILEENATSTSQPTQNKKEVEGYSRYYIYEVLTGDL